MVSGSSRFFHVRGFIVNSIPSKTLSPLPPHRGLFFVCDLSMQRLAWVKRHQGYDCSSKRRADREHHAENDFQALPPG
ncbi:hypothetical protein ALP17_01481 [Pseudomonas savastanoi]|uniref:Uncharacterized protein n=1 Tax=Pseudomonas savastanoi TaxID=29438 RepID=A0A3M6AH52_PSESS|nr:hypothetical protein ALP17_01481 [Pseudomonas savastanoi]